MAQLSKEEMARGIVLISGNKYMTTAGRIMALHEKFPGQVQISSEILNDDEFKIEMMSTVEITSETGTRKFTGFAREYYEVKTQKDVNFASALENCETSAVGRAIGFAGVGLLLESGFASANEIERIGAKERARESQIKAGTQAKVKAKPDDELDDESPISKLRSELKEKRESLKWSSQKIMELVDDEFKVSNWKNLTVDHLKWLIIQCDMAASKAKEDDTSEVAL